MTLRVISEQCSQRRCFQLEERIAPTVTGTGGYDGQPGNQSSAQCNPSGSANPEHK